MKTYLECYFDPFMHAWGILESPVAAIRLLFSQNSSFELRSPSWRTMHLLAVSYRLLLSPVLLVFVMLFCLYLHCFTGVEMWAVAAKRNLYIVSSLLPGWFCGGLPVYLRHNLKAEFPWSSLNPVLLFFRSFHINCSVRCLPFIWSFDSTVIIVANGCRFLSAEV